MFAVFLTLPVSFEESNPRKRKTDLFRCTLAVLVPACYAAVPVI